MPADRKPLGARLAEIYTPDEAELWLTRPQPLLGHMTAVQLIAADREEELHRVLDQIDDCVYI